MPKIVSHAQLLLVGRKIVAVGYHENGGEVWPCLILDDNTRITASMDDEGNGPGSLFIEGVEDGETLCATSLKSG